MAWFVTGAAQSSRYILSISQRKFLNSALCQFAGSMRKTGGCVLISPSVSSPSMFAGSSSLSSLR